MSSLRPSIAAASDAIGVFPDMARREIPVIAARGAIAAPNMRVSSRDGLSTSAAGARLF